MATGLFFGIGLWLIAPAYPGFVEMIPFPRVLKSLADGYWVGLGRAVGGFVIGGALTRGNAIAALAGAIAAAGLHWGLCHWGK